MTVIAARPEAWRLGAIAVVLPFIADPFGTLPNVVALAVVLMTVLMVLTSKPVDNTTSVGLLVLVAIFLIIAAVEILHPNVPSLTVGFLGFRKSATMLLGLVIGLGWRGSRLSGLRLTWWCVFIFCACASLFVHLALPSVEQSIARSADKYTSLLSGVERMQGLFAGPFHVSMAGVFLFLTALAPRVVITRTYVRVGAALVGLACVYLAQVRTGLVAVAIGTVIMLIVTGSVQRWAKRLLMIGAFGLLGILYLKPITEFMNRFTALHLFLEDGLEDSRFVRRFVTWADSIGMISRSPLLGNGSGSSGDTLKPYFAAGDHVTSHNAFLKYAVEGGIVQGLVFATLCVCLVVAVRPRCDATRFGIAAGVTFLVFAFVVAAPESVPVSFGLAVIVGLCVQRPSSTSTRDVSIHRRGAVSKDVMPAGMADASRKNSASWTAKPERTFRCHELQ